MLQATHSLHVKEVRSVLTYEPGCLEHQIIVMWTVTLGATVSGLYHPYSLLSLSRKFIWAFDVPARKLKVAHDEKRVEKPNSIDT